MTLSQLEQLDWTEFAQNGQLEILPSSGVPAQSATSVFGEADAQLEPAAAPSDRRHTSSAAPLALASRHSDSSAREARATQAPGFADESPRPRGRLVVAAESAAGDEANRIDQLVSGALDQPTGFPPVRAAITRDDKIAIALEGGVMRGELVTAAVIRYLRSLGVPPYDITVIVASQAEAAVVRAAHQDEPAVRGVAIEVHHDSVAGENAYLMATADGQAVYVNRRLYDADVVLPIGSPQLPDVDCPAIGAGIPEFCDRSTQQHVGNMRPDSRRRTRLVEQINDWLGVFLSVQVIAAPGGRIADVIVGRREEAMSQARRASQRIWQVGPTASADLVIATIEGGRLEQTWGNLDRALVGAAHLTIEGGQIAVLTDVNVPRERSRRKTKRRRPSGRGPRAADLAGRVGNVLEDHRVFLSSQLDEATVESAGFGFLSTREELQRLAGRCRRVIVLRDAHRCWIHAARG